MERENVGIKLLTKPQSYIQTLLLMLPVFVILLEKKPSQSYQSFLQVNV